jgi:hypothetical protein
MGFSHRPFPVPFARRPVSPGVSPETSVFHPPPGHSPSRHALEPAASPVAGTPPAGFTSTAGSRASRPVPSPTAATKAAPGVSGERAERVRGRSPGCGGAGAEPPSKAPPGAVSFLDTNEITRPRRRGCGRGTA